MGMLFNTDPTVQILKTANEALRKDKLNAIRNSTLKQIILNNIGNLSNAPNRGLYTLVARPLHIDFANDAANSGRWQTYLTYLDNQPDGNEHTKTMAIVIGEQFTLVLGDNTNSYKALEFFAVPLISANPYVAGYDHNNPGDHEKTRIVTIHTVDVDTALHHINHNSFHLKKV